MEFGIFIQNFVPESKREDDPGRRAQGDHG